MAKNKIDLESLSMALEDNSGTFSHYLDRETGEIVFVNEHDGCDEDEDMRKKIEKNQERYLWIEPIPSSDGFKIMEAFIDSLPGGEAKSLFYKALSWKKPFSNFKDVLCDYPDVRKQWFAFHADAMAELAVEWLKENGIDAELVKRQGQ